MDERVKKIKTPEQCEIFTKNCIERGHPELAIQARERAVQLRAEAHGQEQKLKERLLKQSMLTKKCSQQKMERKLVLEELGK